MDLQELAILNANLRAAEWLMSPSGYVRGQVATLALEYCQAHREPMRTYLAAAFLSLGIDTKPVPNRPPVRAAQHRKLMTPYHQMETEVVRRYGDEVGHFLTRRIAKAIRRVQDPCIDHLRIADLSDPAEVAEYDRIAQHCCGSFDAEITHYPSVRTFRYGFSYGH